MDNKAFAPYNFIPFANPPFYRYTKAEDLPQHNKINPKTISGEISVRVTSETPIIVGGSRKKDGNTELVKFYKDSYGDYCIPGSSVRGLLKENVQILGLGAISTFKNEDIEATESKHDKCVFLNKRSYPLKWGLPKSDNSGIDYAKAMFGFIGKNNSYKSRISVGNFRSVGNQQLKTKDYTVMLASPNPTKCIKNYITVNDNSFKLNGFKQYWLKDIDDLKQKYNNKDMLTNFAAVEPVAQFEGTIRFRNLNKDELGLLILAISGPKYQTLGSGKPYGFGRVKFEITEYKETRFDDIYTPEGLNSMSSGNAVIDPEKYIEDFETYISNKKRKTDYDRIKEDFMYIKETVCSDETSPAKKETRYMTSSESKSKDPLPSLSDYRKNK